MDKECPACEGTKVDQIPMDDRNVNEPCMLCGGTGVVESGYEGPRQNEEMGSSATAGQKHDQ